MEEEVVDIEKIKEILLSVQENVISNCESLGKMRMLSFQQSPAVIAELIDNVASLKESMAFFFANVPSKQQEEYAWIILNCCKLIYEIGQPLIWMNHGQYVIESFLYASLSMEGIINLSTAKYFHLRMKLIFSSFMCVLIDQQMLKAESLLNFAAGQVKSLREKEELDLPIPWSTLSVIVESEMDISLLRTCLTFFTNFETLTVSSLTEALSSYSKVNLDGLSLEDREKLHSRNCFDRFICETCRLLQVASYDKNELWKKRASKLIELTWKKLNDKAYDGSLSIECLSEIAALIAYEDIQIQGLEKSVMLTTISTITDNMDKTNKAIYISLIKLSKTVFTLTVRSSDDIPWMKNDEFCSFANNINELIEFDNQELAKRCHMIKLFGNLWSRYAYVLLQQAISQFSFETTMTSSEVTVSRLVPYLNVIVKCLDHVIINDSILYGSLGLLTCMVLKHVGDQRGALSLIRRVITNVEDYRALRVDLDLIRPKTSISYKSLQHLSTSLKLDVISWFASKNEQTEMELNAFKPNGYSTPVECRIDQALSEIHLDLLTLYFRLELEYGVSKLLKKKRFLQDKVKFETQDADDSKAKASKLSKTSKGSSLDSNMKEISSSETKSSEKISIDDIGNVVKSLKAYCCKNPYAKAVLNIELARIEAECNVDKAYEYFRIAKQEIEDAEAKELSMINDFDITCKRDYPIMLARSHKFIYMSPSGMNNEQESFYRIIAKEYGSGTAITISTLTGESQNYKGCNRNIVYDDSKDIQPMRIENLRSGERYVFASIAFDETTNRPIERTLSGTTPTIEALNPLPIMGLWALFAKTVSETIYGKPLTTVENNRSRHQSDSPESFIQTAAEKLFEKYFVKNELFRIDCEIQPKRDYFPVAKYTTCFQIIRLSIGSGINIVAGKNLDLLVESVQKSSPYLLINLIQTYILYIEKNIIPSMVSNHLQLVQWRDNIAYQESILIHLNHLGIISILASSLRHQELTVQCTVVGFNLLSKLLSYDELALLPYIFEPVMNFIISLQSLNQRYWRSLEYGMYNNLFGYLIRSAVITKNLSMVLTVLNEYHTTDEKTSNTYLPNTDTLKGYFSLYESIRQLGGGLISKVYGESSPFHLKIKELFKSKDQPVVNNPVNQGSKGNKSISDANASTMSDVGYLWSMDDLSRRFMVISHLPGIVNYILASDQAVPSEYAQIDKLLKESPKQISDLLSIISLILKELCNLPDLSEVGGFRVIKLLKILPVIDKYLHPDVQEICQRWNLNFIRQVTIHNEADANEQTKTKSSKANTAPSPNVITSIPDRYVDISESEIKLQKKYLGEICLLLSTACMNEDCMRISCPKNLNGGPYQLIRLEDIDSDAIIRNRIDAAVIAQTVDIAFRTSTTNMIEEFPANGILSKIQYVRYLMGSLELFGSTSSCSSTVSVIVRLWSFIIDQWLSPYEFINEFEDLKLNIINFTKSLTLFINQMVSKVTTFQEVDEKSSRSIATTACTLEDNDSDKLSIRTIRQHALSLRDLSWYFISVLFLLNYHEEVVAQGTSILQSFITLSLYDGGIGTATTNLLSIQCKSFSDQIFPLMLYSQNHIIIQSNRLILNVLQSNLQTYIQSYEYEQSTKRKKRPRIARIEKTEEELAYETAKESMMNKIIETEKVLKDNESKLDALSTFEKNYLNYFPIGQVLFDRAKKASEELIHRCNVIKDNGKGSNNELSLNESSSMIDSYEDCLEKEYNLLQQYEKLFEQFTRLLNYLREKKLKSLFLECVNYFGDIQLLFLSNNNNNKVVKDRLGDNITRTVRLRNLWLDGIDCLFSCLDSCLPENWSVICSRLESKFQSKILNSKTTSNTSNMTYDELYDIVPSFLQVISVLGKLIRFTTSNDYDRRHVYAVMAAKLFHYLFFYDSYSHPIELHRFAAYSLVQEIGGYLAVTSRRNVISSEALCLAVDDIIDVLQQNHEYLILLPLFVFMEFYNGAILKSISKWLQMRLKRIEVLVSLQYFSEAASMIAGIKSTISSIKNNSFAYPLSVNNGRAKLSIENLITIMPENSQASNQMGILSRPSSGIPGKQTKKESSKNLNQANKVLKSMPYDTSITGYDFYGYSPFYNHLPLESLENLSAIEWISNYPIEFRTFATQFTDIKFYEDVTLDESRSGISSYDDKKKKKALPSFQSSRNIQSSKFNPSQTSKEGNQASFKDQDKVIVRVLHVYYEQMVSHVCAKFLLKACFRDSVPFKSETSVLKRFRDQTRNIYEQINQNYNITQTSLIDIVEPRVTVIEPLPTSSRRGSNGQLPQLPLKTKTDANDGKKQFLVYDNILYLLSPDNYKLFSASQLNQIKLLLNQHKYREVRSHCLRLLSFISGLNKISSSKEENNNEADDLEIMKINKILTHPLTKSISFNFWIRLKYQLCNVSFIQRRYKECLSLINQVIVNEIASTLHKYWMKRFLLLRCELYLHMNNIESAETDYERLIQYYEQIPNQSVPSESDTNKPSRKYGNELFKESTSTSKTTSKDLYDMIYYQTIQLKVRIMKMKCQYLPKDQMMTEYFKIFEKLLTSYYVVRKCAYTKGFLGYEMNFGENIESYDELTKGFCEDNRDPVSNLNKINENLQLSNDLNEKFDQWSALHRFTELRSWKYHQILLKNSIMDNVRRHLLVSNRNNNTNVNYSSRYDMLVHTSKLLNEKELTGEMYHCCSPYVNNYINEIEEIAYSQVAISSLLDDMINNSYFDGNKSYICPKTDSMDYFLSLSQSPKEIMITVDDHVHEVIFTKNNLIQFQSALNIETIQCMRYSFYVTPKARSLWYLSIGKTLLLKASQMTAPAKTEENESNNRLIGNHIIIPFQRAFNHMLQSYFSWNLLITVCIQLMECYGNNSITWDQNSFSPLKMTVKIMMIALKLRKQQNALISITRGSWDQLIELIRRDNTNTDIESILNSTLPEELSQFVNQLQEKIIDKTDQVELTQQNPSDTARVLQLKPNINSKDNTSMSTNTVREAFLLLSKLIQLESFIWPCMDSSSKQISYQLLLQTLHNLMKKNIPLYQTTFGSITMQFSISESPRNLTVTASSISMLWNDTTSPEDFNVSAIVKIMNEYYGVKGSSYEHKAAYILLGATMSYTTNGTAMNPPIANQSKNNKQSKTSSTPSKSGANSSTGGSIVIQQDPILTKLILFRPDLDFVRDRLQKLQVWYNNVVLTKPAPPQPIASSLLSPQKPTKTSKDKEQQALLQAQQQAALQEQQVIQQQYEEKLQQFEVSLAEVALEYGNILQLIVSLFSKGYIDLNLDTSNRNRKYMEMATSDYLKYLKGPKLNISIINSFGGKSENDSIVCSSLGGGNIVKIIFPSVSVTNNNNAKTLENIDNADPICYVPMSTVVLKNLCDLLNWETDHQDMIDNSLCILFRKVIGSESK